MAPSFIKLLTRSIKGKQSKSYSRKRSIFIQLQYDNNYKLQQPNANETKLPCH